MSAPEFDMTNCPSDETLAEFADKGSAAPSSGSVIEHLSVCGDCRSEVLAVRELAAGHETRRRFNPVVFGGIAAMAAAASVALVFFVPPIRERVLGPKTGIPALVEASATLDKRPIEGRITGEFPYKRFSRLRSPERPDDLHLQVAEGRLEEKANKTGSSDDLHAFGAAQLLRGKPDQAIKTLESVLKQSTGAQDVTTAIQKSDDAALLSDLAAAYLDRYRSDAEAALAAAAADRAWRLEGTLESAWNRALARQAIGRDQSAIAAWQDYLKVDSSSPWAEEARQNIEDLKAY